VVLDRTVKPRPQRRRPGRRALLLGTALALLVAIAASVASAELIEHGNLFVRFDGGIAPRALPRRALAPISVRVEGTIRVPAGERPPALQRLKIALNRAGKIDTHGLPICRPGQIDSVDPSQALAACGRALVGSGGIVGETTLPNQRSTTVRGEVLFFNGVEGGSRTILAHVFETEPTPSTHVFAFTIHRGRGAYGTVLTAEIPAVLRHNESGRLRSIFLQLERRYTYRGRKRSYLSAACSAPQGFDLATFPFARASMTFEDGRMLSSTLVRSCRVR